MQTFFPCAATSPRDVFNERSFAGPSGGDVSDADHRAIEFRGVKSPTTIERETSASDGAIQEDSMEEERLTS